MLRKSHSLWLIALLLMLLTGLLFWGEPAQARSLRHVWNLGHLFYFGLLTYLMLHHRFVRSRTRLVQWLLVLGVTLVCGVLIELLQYGTHRSADMADVGRDLSGSLLVLAFGNKQGFAGFHWAWDWSLKGLAALLLVVQLYPLGITLFDEAMAKVRYPILADFTTPFESTRWTGSAQLSRAGPAELDSNAFLQVRFGTERYSGAFLSHFPGDWRAFSWLRIKLYNPADEPLTVTCRIHDAQHSQGVELYSDRFNRTYRLDPGFNDLIIDLADVAAAPANRQMDLGHIQKLGLFTIRLTKPRTLYIQRVRLE